jgi:hypothetical protein
MTHKIGLSLVAATLIAAPSLADTTSELTVDAGANGSGTIDISIDSLFGSETQSDSVNVDVTGTGDVTLFGASEPFSTCQLDDLQIQLGDGSLSYCFFNIPIFGCTGLDLNFSNFNLGLLDTVTSPVDQTTGMVEFIDATYILSFDYQIISSLFGVTDTYTSTPKDPSISTLSFRIDTNDGNLFIDQMDLSPVLGEIPTESLPTGIYEVLTSTTVNLGAVTMSGTYDPPEPADCTGDFNNDGIVDGGDFGGLLSAWGSCSGCPQDLDGNGSVDGGDVGLFLSLWGPCNP